MTGLAILLSGPLVAGMVLAILLLELLRRLRVTLYSLVADVEVLRGDVCLLGQRVDELIVVHERDRQPILELLSRPLPPPMPSEPPSEPLFIGAFLPTDAHAADLERQVSEAEDHAIAAAGPIRYSPRPSGGSATRYARAPFKPAARRSGSA